MIYERRGVRATPKSRRWHRLLTTGAVFAALVVAAPVAAPRGLSMRTAAATTSYTWPEFHHDAALSGVSADPGISTLNAATLGTAWMANTHAPILGSPVAALDPLSGRTLVYIGSLYSTEYAFDASTGQMVWAHAFMGRTLSTPLVTGGAVWLGSSSTLYKLDASTGAPMCSVDLPGPIFGDPVVGTPPGGSPTIYVTTESTTKASGPLAAIGANCTIGWEWTSYLCVTAGCAGDWTPDTFGVDKNGRALVIFGSDDPDSAVYAVDASTGATAWSFRTINPTANNDVGAGATISPPGVNGFADGVVYVPGKDGYMFALDLTTGATVWPPFHFARDSHSGGSVTAPVLVGSTLVFGNNGGYEYSLDAITGATKHWRYATGALTNVLSSSAVVGPPGNQVVAFGDTAGVFHVLDLAGGTSLYAGQVPGVIASSPADVNGSLIFGSTDGFLYSLTPGGTTSETPSTTVTSPADGSTIANPGASLTIQGSAADSAGVAQVMVAVQKDGTTGPWWNASTATWSGAAVDNPATLTSPGAASTAWSLAVPAAAPGSAYSVIATTVGSGHVADAAGARSTFAVQAAAGSPGLQLSTPWAAQHGHLTLTGSGFQPNEMVNVAMAGTVQRTVTAGPTGALPAKVALTVPSNSPFGPSLISAVGQSSGRATTAVVHVFNSWSQWRGDAMHSGLEPSDKSIFLVPALSPGTMLLKAWSLPTGAAVSGSPAVVNGVAYVGNTNGTVVAVNVRSGSLRWSRTLGGAANSSPAVDNSLVIIGAADGTVSALAAATGALVWQVNTGAAVASSPAVAGGVVYVGSDDHKLYALQESTGAILWSSTLGGAVRSSPAVDTAKGLVVVGDESGAVTAISLSTKLPAWSFVTGGAVDASPLITGGTVYIGSADHVFYARAESTGAAVWSYTTGGAIHSSATDESNEVYVGSDDGNLYGFSPATGSRLLALNLQSPVTGVSAAIGNTFSETAGGTLYGQRAAYQNWQQQDGTSLSGSPSVVDGAIYVGAGDGTLTCYSLFGLAPAV